MCAQVCWILHILHIQDSPYTGFSKHWTNVKLVEVPGNMGVHVSVSFP
jgi:hypothetical protein